VKGSTVTRQKRRRVQQRRTWVAIKILGPSVISASFSIKQSSQTRRAVRIIFQPYLNFNKMCVEKKHVRMKLKRVPHFDEVMMDNKQLYTIAYFNEDNETFT